MMAVVGTLKPPAGRVGVPRRVALWNKVIQNGLIAAVASALLVLSGVFTSFEGRAVISGGLTLNTVVLIALIGGAGLPTGGLSLRHGAHPLLPALVGSLMTGVGLALLVLLENSIDLRFVFANLLTPMSAVLLFGQDLGPGLLILLGVSAVLGLATGGLLLAPRAVRTALLTALGLSVIILLLENQIAQIIALPDALAVVLAFAAGYGAAVRVPTRSPYLRAGVGFVPGAVVGLVLALIVGGGGLARDGLLAGSGTPPAILTLGLTTFLALPLAFGLVGAAGAIARSGTRTFHNGMIFFVVGLTVIGVANAQGGPTALAFVVTFALLLAGLLLVPPLRNAETNAQVAARTPRERARENRLATLVLLAILLILPGFTGQYITNVLNGVGLYIIMGIGLNIVVGYAGLLDLGYVAFFAIGAYTVGLLTTPSLLTCNGVAPEAITPETVAALCPNILTFWAAWPIAIAASALAGVLLGIPVLRLRGDYLAIVTLGFGEIIRIIIKFDDFKPLFGAAQGIANIPRPVLDLTALNPAWRFELTGETGIYYLVLAAILITAAIGGRVVTTRLGRAWLAMRADEDVAQSMGVNLTRTKLLAFALGASFAGMGGALAGVRLFGAYPDSFTVLVSINVLSLIIIGGLGSIPGVVVGALMLVGLPEVLRELSDYRLLAFGVLLVAAMLLKPEGLLPPPVRKLTERLRGSGGTDTPEPQSPPVLSGAGGGQ